MSKIQSLSQDLQSSEDGSTALGQSVSDDLGSGRLRVFEPDELLNQRGRGP